MITLAEDYAARHMLHLSSLDKETRAEVFKELANIFCFDCGEIFEGDKKDCICHRISIKVMETKRQDYDRNE